VCYKEELFILVLKRAGLVFLVFCKLKVMRSFLDSDVIPGNIWLTLLYPDVVDL